MDTITSVIFDWGGVLIEDPAPGLMKYCAQILSVSKEDYIKTHRKFSADFQKNLIREETSWDRICRELNIPKPAIPSLWTEAFKAAYIPREEMFSLAASLKNSGYKTAVISNTEVSVMQYFYQQKYDIFDVLVFSCAEGTIKPEKQIYEPALRKLGCMPEQSVFIDDHPEFIEAAKNAGLQTILFESAGRTREILTKIGIKQAC